MFEALLGDVCLGVFGDPPSGDLDRNSLEMGNACHLSSGSQLCLPALSLESQLSTLPCFREGKLALIEA